MCARQGTFLIDEYDEEFDRRDDVQSDNWEGPLNFPSDFHRALSDCPDELKDEVKRISNFVSRLITQMEWRFRSALNRGDARYEGRITSDLNQFETIEADQIKGLIISPVKSSPGIPGSGENEDFEDAKGKAGQGLYSLCVVPSRPQPPQAKLNTAGEKTADGDGRVRYPKDIYNPIIERCAKEVKRQLGKKATQAEVKRRATVELESHGLKVPRKSIFEQRVKNIFSKK